MTNLAQLTKQLIAARKEIEWLAVGYQTDASRDDVAEFLEACQTVAQLMEDETARRFTRLDMGEIEDAVDGWLESADKVAARRGEG